MRIGGSVENARQSGTVGLLMVKMWGKTLD